MIEGMTPVDSMPSEIVEALVKKEKNKSFFFGVLIGGSILCSSLICNYINNQARTQRFINAELAEWSIDKRNGHSYIVWSGNLNMLVNGVKDE
jgi:hypothetical protein